MAKPSITTIQRIKDVSSEGTVYEYVVRTAKDATTPKVGEHLTEEQVNQLIAAGYTVDIK